MEMVFTKFLPVVRQHASTPNVELEFRVGKINRGSFDTNVGPDTYKKALARLMKYKAWEKTAVSQDTIYYSQNGRRAVSNDVTDDITRVVKHKITKVDQALENQPFDIRLGVATETPYDPDDEDDFDEMKKRTRHSFIRKNLSIDVSMIKGNPDDPDCEDDTSYQIELEIIDPKKIGTDEECYKLMYKIFDVLKITT
jgi:hypothetical protein